ncbi:VCBS domain-containing protein [uncultured Tateyamaria sp.]|uniref:VCBS domain-containing protein n=1 Tax=uncultured Tateyamaria sp. TaxID=455651 RepID=UPI0026024508|nr:VCBS domain-containing protein [uncultured Tateyamaria sp.]
MAEALRTLDGNGFLIQQVVALQDGSVKTTTLTDGVVTSVSWADPLNAWEWTSRLTTFDATTGRIKARESTFDDGSTRTDSFVDGKLTTRLNIDSNNAHAWQSAQAIYDSNGLLVQRVKIFDDGRKTTSTFTNGVETARTIIDTSDAFGWARVDILYDHATGRLFSLTTEFDNGMVQSTSSVTGPVNGSVVTLDEADRFDWTSITKTYDASGQIKEIFRLNDNGVEVVTTLGSGSRKILVSTDTLDAKDWASITTEHISGAMVRTITMDDGVIHSQTYVNGALTFRIFSDFHSQKHDWVSRRFVYDSQGDVEKIETQLDNGLQIHRFFNEAVLQRIEVIDQLDIRDWSQKITYANDAGAILFTNWLYDDGSLVARDVRGRNVIESGTHSVVTEDSAATLTASGTITLTDGYRGQHTFNAITAQLGSAGLGSFTLAADGTWTYSAANNQFGVQSLNVGETIRDTVAVTTSDGVQAVLSVDIRGRADFAPTYTGATSGPPMIIGFVGNMAATPLSFDFGTLFSDDQTDPLSFSLNAVPAGLSLVNGTISSLSALDATGAGRHAVSVTAQDTSGLSATQALVLDIGLHHTFGDNHQGNLDLGDTDNIIVFGDFANWSSSNASLGFGDATNTVTFGDSALSRSTDAALVFGDGNNAVTFGDFAFSNSTGAEMRFGDGDNTINFSRLAGGSGGQLNVFLGTGDNTLTFGHAAAGSAGNLRIEAVDGRNTITFGDNAAESDGTLAVLLGDTGSAVTFGASAGHYTNRLSVVTGIGNDTVTFGQNAGRGYQFGAPDPGDRLIKVKTSGGDDTIVFGAFTESNDASFPFYSSSRIEVDGGSGNDSIRFAGPEAMPLAQVLVAAIDVRGGEGNDTISFGSDAPTNFNSSYQSLEVHGGQGDDVITFGSARGNYVVYDGEGQDTITAAFAATNFTVYFSDDADADLLVLPSAFTAVRLVGFDDTLDTITLDRRRQEVWEESHTVTDGVYQISYQSSQRRAITIESDTLIDLSAHISDFHLNRAPTFVGTSTDLGVAGVGNAVDPFLIDIKAMFSDQDVLDGFSDSLQVRTTDPFGPVGFMYLGVNGLIFRDQTDTSNIGQYTISFRATDSLGRSVTQSFDFEVGLSNDYGNFAPVFYLDDRVEGSAFSDTLTVGTVHYTFENEGGEFHLSAGTGNDAVTIGAITVDANYTFLNLDGGAGDDQITIASLTVTGQGTNNAIAGGTGADTITFIGHAEKVMIDLGGDSDADTLIFGTTMNDVSIANWDHGIDRVDVSDPLAWSVVADDGTETVLSDGTSDLTFLNTTGLTDVGDFLI